MVSDSSSSSSKNDIFNTTWTLPAPAPKARPALTRLVSEKPADELVDGDEEERVPLSHSLQLVILKDHILGSGRHASAFLAIYRTEPNEIWQLCAAKQFTGDAESQIAGIHEAFLLSKLRGCQGVLRYIALKDESSENGTSAETASSARCRQRAMSISTPSTPTEGRMRRLSLASSIPQRSATISSRPAEKERDVDSQTSAQLRQASRQLVLLSTYHRLGNLFHFAKQHGRSVMGERMFLHMAIDLMRALSQIHARYIIHGDVKPQNCLIDSAFHLSLCDFSSSVFPPSAAKDGIAIGTTQYSAPELVRLPPQPFSCGVDLFAAGLTLLFMITGEEPYATLVPGESSRPSTLTKSSRLAARASATSQMVELHSHLSKGNAWEWAERRRLDKLEDSASYPRVSAAGCCASSLAPASQRTIELSKIQLPDQYLSLLGNDHELTICELNVPSNLLDDGHKFMLHAASASAIYPEDNTPVQMYLSKSAIVSHKLRRLLQRMLSAEPKARPSAMEVLRELEGMNVNL